MTIYVSYNQFIGNESKDTLTDTIKNNTVSVTQTNLKNNISNPSDNESIALNKSNVPNSNLSGIHHNKSENFSIFNNSHVSTNKPPVNFLLNFNLLTNENYKLELQYIDSDELAILKKQYFDFRKQDKFIEQLLAFIIEMIETRLK